MYIYFHIHVHIYIYIHTSIYTHRLDIVIKTDYGICFRWTEFTNQLTIMRCMGKNMKRRYMKYYSKDHTNLNGLILDEKIMLEDARWTLANPHQSNMN